jgi:hypothetical protein
MSRNASLHANLRESILPNMVAIRLTAPRIGRAGKFPAACLLCWGMLLGTASAQPAADRWGVRNFITATLSLAAAPGDRDTDRRISDLVVVVRISNHARETQYFGDVPVGAPRLDSGEEASEQKIWEDERCHQRRGLPKASVISVTGAYERGQSRLEASLRHIGLKLPADEIVPGQSLIAGRDGAGRFFAAETRTSRSHVTIRLKIYLTDCTL